MGINLPWQDDFYLSLRELYPSATVKTTTPYLIISAGLKLNFHLIPLDNSFQPDKLIELQAEYKQKNSLLIQLWEDVWRSKPSHVFSRINSFLSLNRSVHGRKSKIEVLSQKQVKEFLNLYHLQGYVAAKYNYGLSIAGELLAVASFSLPRKMKDKSDTYRSAELVRFASKGGCTVVGGLGKLISYFKGQVEINDLMTYADRDWSLGKVYEKLGFSLTDVTPPSTIYLQLDTMQRYFPHRLPQQINADFAAQHQLNFEEFLSVNRFVKIFNTGNLKYHLYL